MTIVTRDPDLPYVPPVLIWFVGPALVLLALSVILLALSVVVGTFLVTVYPLYKAYACQKDARHNRSLALLAASVAVFGIFAFMCYFCYLVWTI